MKFAVVEYSSKSSKIWRHTPEKPNYLADPDKEMDPTSFGCYVSAMQGEHIPVKGLIVGPVNTVSPLTIFTRKIIKRLTGKWPQSYDVSRFATFDVILVVHQMSDAHEMTAFLQKINALPKRPFIIGVPTQPFGLLEQAWQKNPAVEQELKHFMDQCDVFITLAESTLPVWQALSATPTVYVPQPYPVEYVLSLTSSSTAKKPIIFVAGVTDRPNIALGQQAAVILQKEFPQYEIQITQTPGHTQDTSHLTGSRFTIQPFLPWQQQLQYLKDVKLIINTDFTQTRGRVQVDAAAVGTPSIGSDSDGQRDLFPDLPADKNTSLKTIVSQGRRLLTDQAYYDQIVTTARHNLAKLNYTTSAQRLEHVIDSYPEKRV